MTDTAYGTRPAENGTGQGEHPKPKDLGIGALFGLIHEAVVVIDTEKKQIVLWNNAATEIFGYDEEEALGMDPSLLVTPQFGPMSMDKDYTASSGRPLSSYVGTGELLEVECTHKLGQHIRVEASLHMLDEKHMIAINRDVTRKKRTEAMAMALLDSITTYGLAGEVHLPELDAPEGLHNPHTPPSSPLTLRELEVLRHIAQGRQNEQIAAEMYISLSTVKGYCTRIFNKLGVDNRVEAALKAVKQGLLA